MEISYLAIIFIGFLAISSVIYYKIRQLNKGNEDAGMQDLQVLEIQVSRTDIGDAPDSKSVAAEHMFASLHGLLKEDASLQEHVSFEFISSGAGGIRFFVVAPASVMKFVEGQVYAHHPTAQIKMVEDYSRELDGSGLVYDVSLVSLTKPDFFPIKTYKDFEVDTLSALTSAVSEIQEDERVWIQYVIRPLADVWQQEGADYIAAVKAGEDVKKRGRSFIDVFKDAFGDIFREFVDIIADIPVAIFQRPAEDDRSRTPVNVKEEPVRLSVTQEAELEAIESKLGRMGFGVVVRVLSAGESEQRVNINMRHFLASLQQFSIASANSLTPILSPNKSEELKNYESRYFDSDSSMILNTQELATIYHLPSSSVTTPFIAWSYSRKSEPPSNLPTADCVYLGDTLYRSKKVRFGLKNGDDRLRHMYLIGKSGTGKSTLLETMITQDIVNGEGVGILDPHGETIEKILDRIPDHRLDDVIYLDPSDTDRPIGLNLLELEDSSQKNLMASGLVAAIKQHFDYSWGPRLEYLLNYAILTLLEVPGTTMLAITRLLEDKNYRNYILHYVEDSVVKRFWETEYKNLSGNQRFVTEAIAPIQNKVNRFLASPTIRNILGQRNSTINIWEAMNDGKILLMNLSKGKIGSDNANLLGALLVSRLQFYALQRAKIPYEKRRPFYLYVDEFQNFATGSFEEILSESRKYKLGLYLTHQFTAQLPEEILKAVFGNVGTIAAFSLGAPDARAMEYEFSPYFSAEDIISLERFQIYIKLMIDGMTSLPFSARILVPWEGDFVVKKTENRERVLALSREKHGTNREYVEQKISKWIETSFDKGAAIAQEHRSKKGVEEADLSE
ncbi:type IV secretion system DNA-binding domain-containing protein [Patescibacteria group bacterium]|nr:type IV secretion system DNA-binding domain-containing protein [Patescibacteria group bacterium]